ncbi:MAG: divergent polysaccharide deacetylase family protein [Pseudomonadota bacterium]
MVVKKKGSPEKKSVPKKKPVSRKKTISQLLKSRHKPLVLNELKKNLLGILVLVSICLTIAMVADIFFKPGRPDRPDQPEQSDKQDSVTIQTKDQLKPIPIQKPVIEKKPKPVIGGLKDKISSIQNGNKPIEYEVFKDVDPIIVDEPRPSVKDKTPRIAIIIDDIGYDRKTAMALFELHSDITFSVLPFSPFGRQLSQRLHAKGAQLMLHLPMEPVEYPIVNPGPGAILSTMSPDALLDQLKKDLKEIPHIVGVNNHMGSLLTAQSEQMNQIFTILKKENLFFVDSRTAPESQGKASARLLKIRFAWRDVFLDNFQDTEYISGQFQELVNRAKKHGTAIGIGHPYKVTLETLAIQLPKLKQKIKIVRVSELTHIPQ